jgi:hypothetical protein
LYATYWNLNRCLEIFYIIFLKLETRKPKKINLHFIFIFCQVAKFWQIKMAGVEWTRAMGVLLRFLWGIILSSTNNAPSLGNPLI